MLLELMVVRRCRAKAASAKTQGMTPYPLTCSVMLIVMVQMAFFHRHTFFTLLFAWFKKKMFGLFHIAH